MITLSSAVVGTMLASPLAEGHTRSIPLPDCPAVAARFLLDLVYTGTTQIELDDDTFLATLRLAHRWQMESVVAMIETALTRRLQTGNFEDLAEAAELLELPALRRSCKLFAKANVTIAGRLGRRDLRPAVLRLLLPPPPSAASVAASAKKRRTF